MYSEFDIVELYLEGEKINFKNTNVIEFFCKLQNDRILFYIKQILPRCDNCGNQICIVELGIYK